MDRILNSKRETESIYEIYRACRLCGGGAGYKMPIIQTIVDIEDANVELKQKIRDCVQIEVNQDDKMPPLICELCVDKVNDFYEFLEMVKQTNIRTRQRLGLPLQSARKGVQDTGDCILGLTETVYVEEDDEPLSTKQKKNNNKSKSNRKDPVVKIKKENLEEASANKSKSKQESKAGRVTRNSKSEDTIVNIQIIGKKKTETKSVLKPILKKSNRDIDVDLSSILPSGIKRTRDKEPVKLDVPTKRVKISPNPTNNRPSTKPTLKEPSTKSTLRETATKSSPRTSSRTTVKLPPPRASRSSVSSLESSPSCKESPPPSYKEECKCPICGISVKTTQGRTQHLKSHTVSFTKQKFACNPCEVWFTTQNEAFRHHAKHTRGTPYSCNKCQADFDDIDDYDTHLTRNECLPTVEVPDVKCDVCWRLFATEYLLKNHRCLGEDYRPGRKCYKCNRSYELLKNLIKHEESCTPKKKKGDYVIDKALLDKLRPIKIRVARCDALLRKTKISRSKRYDVSFVPHEYGLDPTCYYPFRLRIKSEFRGMVDIQDEIKAAFYPEDFVHWDSEDSEEESTCDDILNPQSKTKNIDSLGALSLKIIFSQRLLGKVPRKKRKIKLDKAFDSIMATEDEVSFNINSIIDHLSVDDCNESDGSYDLMSNAPSIHINKVENNVCVNENNDNDFGNVVLHNDSKVNSSNDLEINDSNNDIENNSTHESLNESNLDDNLIQNKINNLDTENGNDTNFDSNDTSEKLKNNENDSLGDLKDTNETSDKLINNDSLVNTNDSNDTNDKLKNSDNDSLVNANNSNDTSDKLKNSDNDSLVDKNDVNDSNNKMDIVNDSNKIDEQIIIKKQDYFGLGSIEDFS